MHADKPELRDYFPISVDARGGKLNWLRLRRDDLVDPFLFQTIDRRISTGVKLLQTSIEELHTCRQHDVQPHLVFIFHVSRCGSTLVANAMKRAHGSFVFSEPPLSAALFSPTSAADSGGNPNHGILPRAPKLLMGMINSYAAHGEAKRYLCVKFPSCSSLQIQIVRENYPNAAILFLYRDPVEVIALNILSESYLIQMYRFPDLAAATFGIDRADVAAMNVVEFCAFAYAAYCREALSTAGVIPICYEQLTTEKIYHTLMRAGIAPSDLSESDVSDTMLYYSKAAPGTVPFSKERYAERAVGVRTMIEPSQAIVALQAYHDMKWE